MTTAARAIVDDEPDRGAAQPTSAVRLQGVSCRRGGRQVLHDVTFELRRGCVSGVLGPNGAGKSTVLGIITGLLRPSEGQAWVLGEPLPVRGPSLRRRIGVVLQETALYDELTADHNLKFAASLYGVPNPKRRIDDVLELLALSDHRRKIAGALSGGLRRRLAMARALLHEPEMLVIDEPTLGVDAEARHVIWTHVSLLRSRGTTIVVASNYLDEVQAICDAAAVLRDGRLVAFESPSTLVARAGRCVDVECAPDAVGAIEESVAGLHGVIRTELTPTGAAVYVHGDVEPDQVVRVVLSEVHVTGFRVRAADLAEVFRSLAPVEADA
jgi:ABC-type multidrug transport system ATPase subunit